MMPHEILEGNPWEKENHEGRSARWQNSTWQRIATQRGGKSPPWPPPGADGPPVIKLTSPVIHNGNKRQAARIRKEEYRTKRELKAKMRKERRH